MPTASMPRHVHGGPGQLHLGRKEHVTADDIQAARVHFRMDGKAVFQNGVEKMSDAVGEVLHANGLYAGRYRPASYSTGESPHARSHRRPPRAFRGKRST